MAGRRIRAVSNHEATLLILRDAAKTPLLRMRNTVQRADRVQVSPPHSAPTQPSTFNVSGPDTEMWLA